MWPAWGCAELDEARPAPSSSQGHRVLDHTADVIVEAWGRTRTACLEQAVLGLVGTFAEIEKAVPTRCAPIAVDAVDDEDLLVSLLEEVIYRLEVDGVVPVGIELAEEVAGPSAAGVRGWAALATLDALEVIGAAPKAVSRHQLAFRRLVSGWHCQVVIDV